jgi:RNA polymerase sigma factor (sigma-70 family)
MLNHWGQTGPAEPSAIGAQNEDDAALVAAVLRKDRKATAEFVARYTDCVYGYVRSRLMPQYDQVDDLVQEVFLSAWKSLPQYRATGPLQAWVMGITRHKVEDYYRARLRAPELVTEEDETGEFTDRAPGFDEILEQEHIRKKTWQVLGTLPEQYRLALIWRYWERASAREMASKTGKTEKSVERLLARARAEFRGRWNRV